MKNMVLLHIDSVALFLQYRYILEPHSTFKYIFKLQAGYYLKLRIDKYWNVIYYNKPKLDISEKEVIEETEKLLKNAFEYRMIADVPVGLFLSRGYDSSAVAAILQKDRTQKIKTFTIGFYEKDYNKANYAKQVADYLGTDHTEYYCTQKDALEIIPKLPEIYDEPFGDSSAIPTVLVSQLAKKQVTVSLSGDGGYEIFGGSDKYTLALSYFNIFSKLPLKSFIYVLMNNINPNSIPYLKKIYNFETRYLKVKNLLKSESIIEVLEYINNHFTDIQIKNILKIDIKNLSSNFDLKANNDDIFKMLAIYYKTYLVDDILTKVDRTTMSVSLEGREPLLDYRIIEFVSQIPSYYKIRNGEKKCLLKQIVHKYSSKEIMDRPKKGFAVPIFEWFRKELKEYMVYYLSEKRLKREGIFNVKEHYKVKR